LIDIHCHILPGIDDGPADIVESVEMARTAYRDGITMIVATPHISEKLLPAGEIAAGVDALNHRLRDQHIPVTVLRGADVNAFIDPALLANYVVQGTNYILVEFPHSHLPIRARSILFNMTVQGFRPIITHPERNPSIIGNPGLLLDLLDSNSLVQITADSLTGEFGAEAQQCAFYLLERGVVSLIATDAHSNSWRRPILSQGLRVAGDRIGGERASKLVTENPQAVISGSPLYAP